MKSFGFFLFLICIVAFSTAHSQTVLKTDTVAQGSYLPLDSNASSCKISMIPKAGIRYDTTIIGNQIPYNLSLKIAQANTGTFVVYEQYFESERMVVQKTTRYVIGEKNTCIAIHHPSVPYSMTVREIINFPFDDCITSMEFFCVAEGKISSFAVTGNKPDDAAKAVILTLKPGDKVLIAKILCMYANERDAAMLAAIEIRVK